MEYKKDYKFGTEVSNVFIKNVLPLTVGAKVLDFGCGTGEYLGFFNNESLGIDISEKNLKTAKSKGLKVKKMDLNKLEHVNQKFDIVFASHIIEHIENPIELLKFMRKQLGKGGRLIVSIPNEDSLIHLKYPYFTQDGNHLFGFSFDNMVELLNYTGFEIDQIYYDYYTSLTKILGINNFISLVDYLPHQIKNKFAWAFWFVARKKV